MQELAARCAAGRLFVRRVRDEPHRAIEPVVAPRDVRLINGAKGAQEVRMRQGLLVGCIWAALSAARVAVGAYWCEYDASCGQFPEEVGWTRAWGDAVGPHHGGAERSIEDGAFVLDSLASDQIYDFYHIDRSIDPGPGETFIAEWRLAVEGTSGPHPWDVGVTIARDSPPGYVGIRVSSDTVRIESLPAVYVPLPPGGFHTHRVESQDMVHFTYAIDGEQVYSGLFEDITLLKSFVAFGDDAQGATPSLSRWEYLRFGAIPEPNMLSLMFACLVVFRRCMS